MARISPRAVELTRDVLVLLSVVVFVAGKALVRIVVPRQQVCCVIGDRSVRYDCVLRLSRFNAAMTETSTHMSYIYGRGKEEVQIGRLDVEQPLLDSFTGAVISPTEWHGVVADVSALTDVMAVAGTPFRPLRPLTISPLVKSLTDHLHPIVAGNVHPVPAPTTTTSISNFIVS